MKKLLIAISLVTLSGAASAAPQTFLIGGGNWLSQETCNISSCNSVSTDVWDNGETQKEAFQQLGPNLLPKDWFDSAFNIWEPLAPGNEMDGTYSGSLDYDDVTGLVTGGSLIVTGKIGNQVIVNNNSWWSHEYTDLVIDFGAGTATNSNYECRETFNGPATCAGGVSLPAPDAFTPIGGNLDGGNVLNPYLSATFDGTNLVVFREGFNTDPVPNGGTDYLSTFELQVVPIPAAVWLFGSALGLLGFARRRA